MPVLFACPHCNAETVVDDPYVGQSGPCATCGRVVTVPEPEGGRRMSTTQRAAKAGLTLNSVGLLIGVIAGSLAVGAIVIGISVAIIAPAVGSARATSLKNKSGERLTLLAQAMQQYHAMYGTYPPAFIPDAKGKPMHSWRVLILPFLGERQLYSRYDFNQPWDSPANMQLVRQMPEVFASPADSGAQVSFETSYLVIVGPNTVFPGAKAMNMNDITDGPQETILIVESTESGICWLEPKDLDAGKMSYSINGGQPGANCIRSEHPYGAQAVFADSNTHFLTNDLPVEFVEALTTAAKKDQAPLELLAEE